MQISSKKNKKKRTCVFSASGDNPMIHLFFFDHDGHHHDTKRNSASAMQSFFDVPHIRVELMIFCVRGRCPGPLDECGFYNRDFTLEIGCKSTTFFHSGKIIFKIFCNMLIM